MELITLYAMRSLTSVIVLDSKRENVKAIYPNTGYRPTRATKTITFNNCKWKLKWLDDNGKLIN
jgi:hypothetical protein